MESWIKLLPAVNATLNAIAAVLLVAGWFAIKRRQERAHKALMLSAFGVSIAFLACYVIYHLRVKHVEFNGPADVRMIYYSILFSHIVLAVTVPFLASATIYLGLRDRREKHRHLARWTLPIWLYVSVTGVVVYMMLYQLYPASENTSIITVRQGSLAVPPGGDARPQE